MTMTRIMNGLKQGKARVSRWIFRKPIMAAIRGSLKPSLPRCAEIETTTVCTRRCAYCPVSSRPRPQALMEEGTFRKIIDDLADLGFKGEVHPHFYGEPLCDLRLETFARYAKAKLPACLFKVYTNGDLLTPERFHSLNDAGVDVFRISRHGKSLGAALVTLKEQYPAKIEIVGYGEQAGNLMNRGGLLDLPRRPEQPCYFVNAITIDYLGNMLLCCNDYGASVILGNVNRDSIKRIWHRHRIRRSFIMSGLWFYPICRKC